MNAPQGNGVFAGSLESANWSILAAHNLFKEVEGKNQDFMLIRFYKENDLIGCGGDPQPVGVRIGVRIGVGIGVRTIYEHGPTCGILTLFNIFVINCSMFQN